MGRLWLHGKRAPFFHPCLLSQSGSHMFGDPLYWRHLLAWNLFFATVYLADWERKGRYAFLIIIRVKRGKANAKHLVASLFYNAWSEKSRNCLNQARHVTADHTCLSIIMIRARLKRANLSLPLHQIESEKAQCPGLPRLKIDFADLKILSTQVLAEAAAVL